MTTPLLSCTVDDHELTDLVERLRRKLGNMNAPMSEIGQRYERSVLANFAGERDPGGAPWPRLSATTLMLGLAKKKGIGKRGGLTKKGREYLTSKSLLVAKGRLRSRVHYQADANSVRIGVAGIAYAAIHQFGGMAGRGRKVRIPARPWLALNRGKDMVLAPMDKRMVIDVLNRYLTER